MYEEEIINWLALIIITDFMMQVVIKKNNRIKTALDVSSECILA
jgi:hypothetical protein